LAAYCIPVFLFHLTSTPAIYTLSLHAALPIFALDVHVARLARRHRRAVLVEDLQLLAGDRLAAGARAQVVEPVGAVDVEHLGRTDRKSTRLNSSHRTISYAVFCLKKKISKEHK